MTAAAPLMFRAMTRTAADFERFAACFSANGMLRRSEDVRWQFGENPTRHIWVEFALQTGVDAERLAAIYAVMPLRMRQLGGTFLAAQSVDTITDAAFRGRGLFLKLAKDCYDRAKLGGAAFVFGFPNGNSAHGFFRKLGWVSLDPVPFLLRPMSVRYFAERFQVPQRLIPDLRFPAFAPRLAHGQRLVALATHDERVTELWNEFASGIGIAVERDVPYLKWRLGRPGAGYRALGVVDGDRLVAFGVFRMTDKHGGRIGYVLELLHRKDGSRAADAILGAMLREMRAERADAVLAWNLAHSPNHLAFLKAGFVPLPERLRPIELHFGVASLREPKDEAAFDRRSWYLSYLDSDTV